MVGAGDGNRPPHSFSPAGSSNPTKSLLFKLQLLLLEAIELYGDDWSKIAEHVGTRTKEKCILHFLQMPIEEPFLEAQTSGLGASMPQSLPFSQTDNPVMATLAFLASTVSPAIASAAAKAALTEYTKGTEQAAIADQPDKSSSVSNNDGKAEMEVDQGEGLGDKAAELKAHLERTTATALAAAATKAYVLAQAEERKLQKLVIEAVESQVKKLELKLTHFEELEKMLGNEKKQIERQRAQLFQDRLALRKAMMLSDPNPQQTVGVPLTSSYQASSSLPASNDQDLFMGSL